MTNEEGFITLAIVAVISFIVGVIKIRHYYSLPQPHETDSNVAHEI